MKKTLKNSLAGILICIAVLLLFSEYDFNNTTELLYFVFIKMLGFVFGYIGFKILDY